MNYLSKEKERAKIRKQTPEFWFASEVDFDTTAREDYQLRYTSMRDKRYWKTHAHRIARRKGDAELRKGEDALSYDNKVFDYQWKID